MDENDEVPVVAFAHSPSVISKDHEEADNGTDGNNEDRKEVFQARTIRSHSVNSERRIALLPAYPLSQNDASRVLLLLSNVPNMDRDKCEKDSFCGGHGICSFEVKLHRFIEPIDSFMVDLYNDLFLEPSREWKIHHSIIDYNLSRLRRSMDLYTKQTKEPAFSCLKELKLALEFFLQIDVDTFFMKTCNYRGAQPRLFGDDANRTVEGILCEAQPMARYGIEPCYERHCFLCKHERAHRRVAADSGGIRFISKQIHHFVNKYEAILNCPAKCTTSNVIYALTCVCGKFEYIDSTSTSFYDRILKHRSESNRIIREFLIGMNNIDLLSKQVARSEEMLMNNNMLLYQHLPRCHLVLQHFLERNPNYWCLVPMSFVEAKDDDIVRVSTSACSPPSVAANSIYNAPRPFFPESPTFVVKPQFFEEVLRNNTRNENECIWLAKNLPKPPSGYRFSLRQIQEQLDFFKFKKETHILPEHLVDCYRYTIIAVLPDDCSYELRRFIETLFITHAETNLNTFGRLTLRGKWSSPSTSSFDHSNRGLWCDKLVRHSSS